MKKLLVILLSINALHAMQPGDKKWPHDIYEAIKKNNQAAIDYYISCGQVNINDTIIKPAIDNGGHSTFRVQSGGECTCFCKTSCCCIFPIPPCCIPFPCSPGTKKLTPLYVAISKNNFEAARKLITAGAKLNAGMWVKHDKSCFCDPVSNYHLYLKSSALKLATLARKRSDAKNLLQVVVQQNRPLLDSSFPIIMHWTYCGEHASDAECAGYDNITKTNCSNELCNALIDLKDPQLLESIMQNQLIPPAMLACAAAQKKKTRDLFSVISHYHGPINDELLQQLCTAIAKTGDQHLVAYLLEQHPSLAVIDNLLPHVRNITVASQLLAYRAHAVNQLPIPAPIQIPNAQPLAPVCAPSAQLLGQQQLNVPQEVNDASSVHLYPAGEHLMQPNVPGQTQPSQASSSNAKADDCPICFEPLNFGNYVRRLPCGHNFHAQCISTWLEHQNTCPLCKKICLEPLNFR